MAYLDFFNRATGFDQGPYEYQLRLAKEPWPDLIDVPTGLGKTAAVVLAWLFKRSQKDQTTPRRLVYCLPMRVLVEQTAENVRAWLQSLGMLGHLGEGKVSVHVLMGGSENLKTWAEYPEEDMILVGTQDMLLSRALMRGYGMSRYLWPVHFAMLHSDALWVMDETQLMGVGVETTAQLHGLRKQFGTFGQSHSIWMSATLGTEGLSTVDHKPVAELRTLSLGEKDYQSGQVKQRVSAPKKVTHLELLVGLKEKQFAAEVAKVAVQNHVNGSLTLVIVNRVSRSQEVFKAIQKELSKTEAPPKLALIHSQMRQQDRSVQENVLLSKGIDRIIVATQAVEAGVDVSASTLVTELAPWPSLVQRIGRCNRYGEVDDANVMWIDTRQDPTPYSASELEQSFALMKRTTNAAPDVLRNVSESYIAPQEVRPVIRKKDLLDLFDTTPDLAGNDLDVSRYIRDTDDTDCQVYWRSFDGEPTGELPAPTQAELCSVSVSRLNEFIGKDKKGFRWDTVQGRWLPLASTSKARPGMLVLLRLTDGGYDDLLGWTGISKDTPTLLEIGNVSKQALEQLEADADTLIGRWVSITEHSSDVARHASQLQAALEADIPDVPWAAIEKASRWHDLGKAHPAFQAALKAATQHQPSPDDGELWAKSASNGLLRFALPDGTRRTGFRHELASALAWLEQAPKGDSKNLIAFLIAAHHGKVRLSIRSLPNEPIPDHDTTRYARGVWDGDILPSVDLGDNQVTNAVTLGLEYMELGESEKGPSWLSRTLALRNSWGPFRLAFLEALVRIADWRASKEEQKKEAINALIA